MVLHERELVHLGRLVSPATNKRTNNLMRRSAIATFMWIIIAAYVSAEASAREYPNMVLFDGKIFTGNDAHSYVEALAIRRDRIVATGTSRRIEAMEGPTTQRIDLRGRTVIPGMSDAHAHLHVHPADRYTLKTKLDDPTWADIRHSQAQSRLARNSMYRFSAAIFIILPVAL
jgi:hypothetical protein